MECLCTGAGDTFTILKKPVPVWETRSIYITKNIRHHKLHTKEKGQKMPEAAVLRNVFRVLQMGTNIPKRISGRGV